MRWLSRYDWLLLVVLAPAVFYADRISPLLVNVALLLLLLPLFGHFVAARHFITRTPLDIPIFCLLLTVPLSLYASANLTTSLPRLTGLLFGIVLFYTVVRWGADAARWQLVVTAWLLSVIGIALLGIIGVDWTVVKFSLLNPVTSRLPRLVTGLGNRAGQGFHPNEVAGTLALFIAPLLNALWPHRENDPISQRVPRLPKRIFDLEAWALRWLYPDHLAGQLTWLFGLLLIGGLFVLTQSRSALFGVTVSLVLLGAVRSRIWRWLAVVGLAAALIVLVILGPTRLGEAMLGTGGVSAVGSLDFAGRMEVWSRALYAIQDFPFTGVGLNQFEPVLKLLYPLFLVEPDAPVPHAHDIYLQVAVDFGLGGLVAYAAILAAAALMAVRAYRRLPASLSRRLVLGLACGLLAHQLFGLTDAVTLGAKPSFEWWLTLALISGIYVQASPPSQPRCIHWRVSPLEVLAFWLLGGLIAIAVVGDNALLGVLLAVLAGCVLGWGALMQFEGSP